MFLLMFLGIHLPPKFLGEVFSIIAHALEVIQIFGGDRLQDPPHAWHGKWRDPIARPRTIEHLHKICHELPALGRAFLLLCGFGDVRANMVHSYSIKRMAYLSQMTKIVQVGDPVLRKKAKAVLKKDLSTPKFKTLLKHMSEALKKEEFGVAIAAPQVGEPARVFLVAGRVFSEGEADKVFINPEIIRLSKRKKVMSEGCLSVRHKYGTVMRHEKATVRAWDESGKEFTYHGSELLGHIFQHECDHLDGVLYIDKAVAIEEDRDWQKLGEKRRTGAH